MRFFLFTILILITQAVSAQFTAEDSLILRNIPEGKFKMLTDGIYPNEMTHIGRGLLPLPKYYQWKRKLSAKIGLDYVLVSSPIFQWSTNGNYTANIENDLLGKWRLIENEKSNANISYWFLHTHNLSDLYTGEFSRKEGLSLETSLGDVPYQDYFAIMSLWWEHSFANDRIMYRVGHINSNTIWASNKYINDDRDGFMNSVSSSAVGAQWVGNKSLGLTVSYLDKMYNVTFGMQAANAEQTHPDFNALSSGEFIYTGEIGITPKFKNSSGEYVLNIATQPVNNKQVVSTVVNLRQDILKENLGLFVRFASNDNQGATVANATTAGIYVNSPFKYTSDAVGVAYVNTSQRNETNRDEGIEAFYRVLLTHRLDFSADWMHFWQTTNSGSTNVFSTRLRFIL